VLRFGDISVAAVEESVQASFTPAALFLDFDPQAIDRHLSWMAPLHFDPAEGRFRTSVRTFVVKTPRSTILIDTCGGNDKHRPFFPRFHQQRRPWLARLREAGVAPEQVDFVMCTHLHADHVGWNTVLADGRWTPTFPNAKYVFHRAEMERWNPTHPSFRFAPHNEFAWEDSVLPVIAAGQAVAIEDGHVLDHALTVEATPGHTLGHVAIRLRAGERQAIFSGDVMHVPLQIHYPGWGITLDDDPQQGVRSRLQLLAQCADARTLVLPTHFVPASGCFIVRAAGGFAPEWNSTA